MVFNEVDDVVVEFPYTRKRYGYLTGQQGFLIIKRISAETQVRHCPRILSSPAPAGCTHSDAAAPMSHRTF